MEKPTHRTPTRESIQTYFNRWLKQLNRGLIPIWAPPLVLAFLAAFLPTDRSPLQQPLLMSLTVLVTLRVVVQLRALKKRMFESFETEFMAPMERLFLTIHKIHRHDYEFLPEESQQSFTQAPFRELKSVGRTQADNEEIISMLLALSRDAVFILDSEGNIVNMNSRACALVSYTEEQLRGISIRKLITGSETVNDPFLEIEMELADQPQETKILRCSFLTNQGEEVACRIWGRKRMAPYGTALGYILLAAQE